MISVSGRCHNRTSHWKGAVTLISTCLCQMLLLPSYLISSRALNSLRNPERLHEAFVHALIQSWYVRDTALRRIASHWPPLRPSPQHDTMIIELSLHPMHSLSIVEGGLPDRMQAADHQYSREVSLELTVRVRQQCSRKPASSGCLSMYGTQSFRAG